MQQLPVAADLLDCTAASLQNELLPLVPPEGRHLLLMAINAIGIAQRQARNAAAHRQIEHEALSSLLPTPCADVEEGNRLLAAEIRQGMADPGSARRDAIYRFLVEVARQRLAESNPKALSRQGGANPA